MTKATFLTIFGARVCVSYQLSKQLNHQMFIYTPPPNQIVFIICVQKGQQNLSM